MPIPNDLQRHGPGGSEVPVSQMQDEMRKRGIPEDEIRRATGQVGKPGFELKLTPQNSPPPPDLTRKGPNPNPYADRAGNKLMDYLFGASKNTPPPAVQGLENVSQTANDYAPSATTAATMAIPGLGLVPALARTGVATVGRGAEAASRGEDPVRAGLISGAIQGGTEMIAPGANKAMQFAADLPMLGGTTRAVRGLTNAVSNMNKTPAPPPGEYMGKFVPSGIPKGTPLLGGKVAAADIPAEMIPHPTLPGWTAADILNQVTKPPAAANPWTHKMEALFRLLGIGAGAESANQQGAK